MDMISALQGQITTLSRQVNNLVQQVANHSLYRTMDQTSASSPILNQTRNEVSEEEMPKSRNGVSAAVTPNTLDVCLPRSAPELSDLQTAQYSEVVRRTSTPIDSVNGTPQRSAPRRTLQPNVPRSSPRPLPMTKNNQANQILLIGDSLISSVNPKGLRKNMIKNRISGANIEKITTQMKVYDISKFSHVIPVMYVGGNDASSGTDIEYFEEMYDRLIQHIKEASSHCKIILCNSCPRGDTSTTELNDIIQTLAEHHGTR